MDDEQERRPRPLLCDEGGSHGDLDCSDFAGSDFAPIAGDRHGLDAEPTDGVSILIRLSRAQRYPRAHAAVVSSRSNARWAFVLPTWLPGAWAVASTTSWRRPFLVFDAMEL